MNSQKTCPSTTGDTLTAEIIGVIGTDGLVRSIPTSILLTDEMCESVGPRPERIFRLAGPCMEAKCANWRNEACTLIDRLREQAERLHSWPKW